MTVAAALVPIFFAMAVGYGAGMTGLVDNRHVDALNTVVMVIALPIALFTILASSDRADIVEHSCRRCHRHGPSAPESRCRAARTPQVRSRDSAAGWLIGV